ncbi:phosphatidate cytidylyltransferase [Saxibacter everestensis]|uniref:Phosphatidate cytidylyltransferase n=1 Tax=Saxibacter everestensis TaxID=2909229 RepID=A0ABY8QXZ2_9MICO|nr:phosphatidate cytidylyltransferase [Brevibacteriaceae bacterium ZFBP1038]
MMSSSPEVSRSHGRRRAEPLVIDHGRAGRDLTSAIIVGALIGATVLCSLLIMPDLYVLVVIAGVMAALWELGAALNRTGARVARVPAMVGGACMVVATHFGGAEALWVSFALACGAILLWGVLERKPQAVKDVSLGIFAIGYVALLACFTVLMLEHPEGWARVLIFLALVVASDLGGYIIGIFFGKHPIATKISPKKSWEGFAGSAVFGIGIGLWLVPWLLDGPWWIAVVLGLVMPVTATLGDFAESMIKRDLRLKDMGTLLPGHGGVMDRLDSILPAAPVAYLLFMILPGMN